MPDLSQIPTEQLMQMYRAAPAAPDLSQVSTEDLLKAYHASAPKSTLQNIGETISDATTGVGQGVSLGFADELFSAGLTPFEMARGALNGQDAGKGIGQRVSDAYDRALSFNRSIDKAAQERSPIAFGTGEAIGALTTASPATGPVRAAPGFLSRVGTAARQGGAYGAAYGAGTAEGGIEDRLKGALKGGATGLVIGAASVPVIEGALGVARGIGNAFQPLRGAINPEQEAVRRVGTAIERDNPNVPNALDQAANTLEQANNRGVPLAVADTGGQTTQRLARTAANSSSEAQAALNRTVNDRFETQNDRIENVVHGIVGGNPNAPEVREALKQTRYIVSKPYYQQAIREGSGGYWTPDLANLVQAPEVQDAIRVAQANAKNWAVKDGLKPPLGAFVIEDGKTALRKTATGEYRPSLQLWDYVKRALDQTGTPTAKSFSRTIRDEMDAVFPSYQKARGVSATFFKADNAIEAGQQFASSNAPLKEARMAWSKMSRPERAMFAQGFASDLLDKISKVPDRQNVINKIFGSSDAKDRIALALGPGGLQRLEAAARVENVMDRLRTAVQGNSSTARQLADLARAGLTSASNPIGAAIAGGATGLLTGDYKTAGLVFAGLLSRRGLSAIDERVSRRVGEMLASNDPNILRQAYEMIGRSRTLLNAVRRVEQEVSRGVVPVSPQLQLPGGAVPAVAEDEKQD